MNLTLSTYEAKARFSEVMRLVREGRTVHVSYHGKPVAEIRPIQEERKKTLEEHLDDLERRGLVSPPAEPGPFRPGPVVRRPGALQRFLDERE
ncbi:MAG: type II toxin-antitoxin system prevent-host-death family antitoxin [Acidobacteriota bacterium]|nr:type II toxin-antitoxin system prevent-host-death family antitoxin [Acidobacteriota bacterium]MDE3261699.1 type II toxin-antitoxin system prevent-host-death family antitoxin [Acidobacteriota bacterium]